MRAETLLDSVVFKLTPTRTRGELVISANGESETLATGLLQPFITHLRTAAEQIAKGGYSIRLEPPSGNQHAPWFTKGTVERFVRFVSTPEVVERINTVETEIIQIEEAINSQCNEAFTVEDQSVRSASDNHEEARRPIFHENSDNAIVPYQVRKPLIDGAESTHGENSKACLLRVLETRRVALQKEQGMAFARAAAAGFDLEIMPDLVSFAECFGASRLREACLKFMEAWRKKQEAGLWSEEMDLEALETSSARSILNTSGFLLNSNSVCPVKPNHLHDAMSDAPCEVDSKPSSQDGSNGNEKSQRSGEVRLTTDQQTHQLMGLGTNDIHSHLQQPMMPSWQGQTPHYIQQHFHPPGMGLGQTMPGVHGYPMQGVPYYPSYPMNPHLYQGLHAPSMDHIHTPMHPAYVSSTTAEVAENSRQGSNQMMELHPREKSQAKHLSTAYENSVGSESDNSKSVQGSDDEDSQVQSEEEEEIEKRNSSTSYKKGSSRQLGSRKSGMVVIRNINYITSKRHDRNNKDGNSDYSGSDLEIIEDEIKKKAGDVPLHVKEVVDLFEKKSKSGSSSKKKDSRRNLVESVHSSPSESKSPKHDLSTDADNEGWNIFEKYLLGDGDTSPSGVDGNNQAKSSSTGQQKDCCDEMVDRNFRNSEDHQASPVSFEQELAIHKKEAGVLNETIILPGQREKLVSDSLHLADNEAHSHLRKLAAQDEFIVSREMTADGTFKDPLAGDVAEYDYVHRGNRQDLQDDSFMIPANSVAHDHNDNDWKAIMNFDSEVHQPYNLDEELESLKGIHRSSEPAELYMIPERAFEDRSSGTPWDLAIDYEMEANMANKGQPTSNHDDKAIEESNSIDASMSTKRHPKKKISEREARLKSMQEALEKRKADMASRHAKQGKPNPLAEAQMRAQKLRAFKAGLRKTKEEMEEEERKRLEELKIQRQKRIAARRSTSPTSSTSTPRSIKQQLRKPASSSKLLSSSSHKGHGSRALSPGSSFPASSSNSESNALSIRLKSQNQTTPNHKRGSTNQLSESVISLPEMKREEKTSNVVKRLSATRKSYDQASVTRTEKVLDNESKKRTLPETRKSLMNNESKEKPSKSSLSDNTQKPRRSNIQTANKVKSSSSDTSAGKRKIKGKIIVDEPKKGSAGAASAESSDMAKRENRKAVSPEERNYLESSSVSDDDSCKKAGVGPGYVMIHAPASNNGPDNANEDSADSSEFQGSVRARVKVGDYDAKDALSDVQEEEGRTIHSPNPSFQEFRDNEPYFAPIARMTSFEDPSLSKTTSNNGIQLSDSTSESNRAVIPRVPISENDSFAENPVSLQTMVEASQSVLSVADTGNYEASLSQQKGNHVEKSKEGSKVFKKIWKFGRKSSSNTIISESHEDVDHLKLGVGSLLKVKAGISDGNKHGDTDKSHPPFMTTATSNGAPAANSLGNLISQDEDVGPVPNTHKASRSFFTLPTFRSKGNETKAR